MEIGLKHISTLVVTEKELALNVGSGDLPVLATPAMLALMENAAMLAVKEALPHDSTTVGGMIESSHLKPTKLGNAVKATATLEKIEGRKLYFKVEAYEGETLIGSGKHLRFIVERDKFLSKL